MRWRDGIEAELGEHAPVLQVGEAVFARGAFAGHELVRLLLRGGQPSAAGGAVAGDDHRVVGVVVEAEEAKVGERADACFAQVGGDAVVPGGSDVMGAAAPGARDPYQIAVLVGEGEDMQAVHLAFAGVVRAVVGAGWVSGCRR